MNRIHIAERSREDILNGGRGWGQGRGGGAGAGRAVD